MTAPRSGRVTALRARAIGALATAGMIAGCATMARRPAAAPPPEEGLAGWQALVEGHAADAKRGFARALVDRPDDAVALYGQAALADARGAGEAAAAAYVATLAALGGGASPFTAALAPP